MSMNVTRGDFIHDYVVARPRPSVLPGGIAMTAMIVVLALMLAAAALGRGVADEAQGDGAPDVLLQGP